jgi:hypothetical protein
MDLMCLRNFIAKCSMHIVILKDKLFYVQENSKGFIKNKKWKKNEKNSNKLYSINK